MPSINHNYQNLQNIKSDSMSARRAVAVVVVLPGDKTNAGHTVWAVRRGRRTGIFNDPDEARRSVEHFPGACWMGFKKQQYTEFVDGVPDNDIAYYLSRTEDYQLSKVRDEGTRKKLRRRDQEEEEEEDEPPVPDEPAARSPRAEHLPVKKRK